MKISYKHLLRFIPAKPTISDLSKKLFQLGHEHEVNIDGIFDIEFTPNRGDCLSLIGLTRDLNVFYDTNPELPLYDLDIPGLDIEFINKAKDECPNISFLNIEIEGEISEYKDYLNSYFIDLGVKKNNFFTDVSNYIAYELGQPTHSYDFSLIDNEIVLENVKNKIMFTTLLDDELELKKNDLVFTSKNDVINLAGIIGGKNTSCTNRTSNALIECAYFKPESIINKAVKYNINSEASYKFERGVDPQCHERVLRRFVQIVKDHARVLKIEIYSQAPIKHNQKELEFDMQRINQILGINYSPLDYKKALSRLGFKINGNIIVPSYRNDICHQNDLAEELARIVGYDNLPRKSINFPKNLNEASTKFELSDKKIKHFLISNGFNEVINNPFSCENNSESIKVDNPLDTNREFLRTNVLDSLIQNLLYNENRQHDSIKLFEISDVYSICSEGKKISQKKYLSAIISGRRGHNHRDFSKKLDKNYFVSLFNSIDIEIAKDVLSINRDKIDSKFKTPIYAIEVPLDKINGQFETYNYEQDNSQDFAVFKPISEFPSSSRDISFSIKNSEKIEDVLEELNKTSADFLKSSFIFDFYFNKNTQETKVGFRAIFQSHSKTLTDHEIQKSLNKIVKPILSIESVTIPGLHKN